MIDTPRGRESLGKLLKLARADVDALRVDLVDIESARVAATDSLDGLDRDLAREEEAMKDAHASDVAAYLEGVRERRRNLYVTLATLTQAEDDVRDKLNNAFIEIKKLEHLIDVNVAAEKKAHGRKTQLAADDVIAARGRAF